MEKRNRFKKVYVEISNICNLNCPFCAKTNREKKSLDTSEFKIILNKIKPYTKYLYLHVLGEPLLHPNINEFIDISSKDFYVNITSNGYLVNNLKTKNIRQINISLHSFDEKYHKSLDEYLNDLYNFSLNNNQDTYINYRLWTNSKYCDDIISFLEKRYNVKITAGVSSKLDKNIFLDFGNEFIWPTNAEREVDSNNTCYALTDHIAILSNGNVSACCLDAAGEISLGNIFSNSMEDIINGDLFKNMYEGFKNSKKIHPLCLKCNFIETKKRN